MGKIVASGGCSILDVEDRPMLDFIISSARKKEPSVLFLPTASFDREDDIGLYEERLLSLGCSSLDVLYLTDESLTAEEIREKIIGADIIFAGGGNLKFLMDTWEKTNADKYLKEAFDNGTVLSGTSSGAMCWFERGYDDCGENGSFMFVDCLGFLPFCNCPHFENENWQSFKEAVKKQSLSGVAIDNTTALAFIDGEYKVIECLNEKTAYFFDKNNNYKMSRFKEQCAAAYK